MIINFQFYLAKHITIDRASVCLSGGGGGAICAAAANTQIS